MQPPFYKDNCPYGPYFLEAAVLTGYVELVLKFKILNGKSQQIPLRP